MSMQLVLLDDTQRSWKMDERTRELGKRGVSEAHEALRAVPRRSDDEVDVAHPHAA